MKTKLVIILLFNAIYIGKAQEILRYFYPIGETRTLMGNAESGMEVLFKFTAANDGYYYINQQNFMDGKPLFLIQDIITIKEDKIERIKRTRFREVDNDKEIIIQLPNKDDIKSWAVDLEGGTVHKKYTSRFVYLKIKDKYNNYQIIKSIKVTEDVVVGKDKFKNITYWGENIGFILLKGRDGKVIRYNEELASSDHQELSDKEALAETKRIEEAKQIEAAKREEKRRREEERKLFAFLQERATKIYDYKMLAKDKYNSQDNAIEIELQQMLSDEKATINTDITINYTVDTLNAKKTSVSKTTNTAIDAKLNRIASEIDLSPLELNNYLVNSKADFKYHLLSEKPVIVNLKKNSTGVKFEAASLNESHKTRANQMVSEFPEGKYSLQLRRVAVNNNERYDEKVLKYRGNKPVGMWTFLGVVGAGSLGGGWYFYQSSQKAYDDYHNATQQADMDTFYDKANQQNKIAIGLAAVGAAICISDIIWIATNSAHNKKLQRAFEQSRLSLRYNSQFNAKGLSYTLNF